MPWARVVNVAVAEGVGFRGYFQGFNSRLQVGCNKSEVSRMTPRFDLLSNLENGIVILEIRATL